MVDTVDSLQMSLPKLDKKDGVNTATIHDSVTDTNSSSGVNLSETPKQNVSVSDTVQGVIFNPGNTKVSVSAKPLPKIAHTVPIQIPKVINTPEGNIPLNSNINNSMKKSTTLGNKSNAGQLARSTETPTSKISNTTSKSNGSVVPVQRPTVATTVNINTPSVKLTKSAPVPIKRNPNTPPSVQFHPIAIKPRPKSLQPAPGKVRTKPVAVSRSSSVSSPHSKDSSVGDGNSNTITLSTSKNWVLPPRPKTKKVSKKKDKKTTKAGVTDINVTKTGPFTVKKLPTSLSASPSPSLLPSTIGTSPSTKLNISNPKSSTTIKSNKTTLQDQTSASIDNAARNLKAVGLDNSSNKCTSSKCTGCAKVCIANGIRSVYQDKTSGKVLINAQIHSNINLYTNNEKELELQLQHVSRENDNLKKILLKLNKEIQNLKLVKKKEEANTQCTKKARTASPELSKSNLVERKSTPVDVYLTKIKEEKSEKSEKSDTIDFGFGEIPNFATNVKREPKTLNTVNPLNLSYHSENENQKAPDVKLKLKPAAAKPKAKPRAKAKPKEKPQATKFHSCGVCKVDQKCICFETQLQTSIASGIVQAFSNSKILNTVNQSNPGVLKQTGGGSTLSTILHREDIMKKLKSEDKKTNTSVKTPIETSKPVIDTSNTNNKPIQMKDEIMNDASAQEDDNLLQLIDAELLFDSAPIVPSKLMINAGTSSTKDLHKDTRKSCEENNLDYFNRGTLMDFNQFNPDDDMMMHEDTFNGSRNDHKYNDKLQNNDTTITTTDMDPGQDHSFQNLLLFENGLHSGDEFMMY